MKILYFLIILCITLSCSSGCLENSKNTSDYQIKIVGKASYDTMQNAINHASNGDTILIAKGTFNEHILVNKSIKLIGVHKDHTIIDGNNSSTVCTIISDNVRIMNISVRNSGSNDNDAGISIQSNGCRIDHCSFYRNYKAIAIYSEQTTRNNIVTNNTVYHNHHGVYVKESNRNHITFNTICNNSGYGIFLDFYANSNQLNNNIITTNEIGIRIKTAILNTVTKNWVINNTAKGIHLCCSSHDNIMYQNYLINNSVNALDKFSNQWNTKDKGNYWSDYLKQQPDATDDNHDGIWDTPYIIEEENTTDVYPLTTYPPYKL